MYKITSKHPTELVEHFTSLFERTNSGWRGWSVTELYKEAVAYRGINGCPTKDEHNKFIICDPAEGFGADFFTTKGTFFSFDECYDERAQAEIKRQWFNRHEQSLDFRWKIEEEYVKIPAGFTVDLIRPVDDFGYAVIEENVTLSDYIH